jgi:hypothetical protein
MVDQHDERTACERASTTSGPTVPSMDATGMNIKQARRVYKDFGRSLNPDFESWVRLFRRLNIDAPIANVNYLHALSLTDLMFRHADNKLDMVTGGQGDGFIEVLKDSFISMLERIRRNNGAARVIVFNGRATVLQQIVDNAFANVLTVRRATMRPGAVIRHFIVADDDMVRDEEPHEELTDLTDANKVRAKVYFKNPSQARVASSRFTAMWEAVSGTE